MSEEVKINEDLNEGQCPQCGGYEGCCCSLVGMVVVHPDRIEKLEAENASLKLKLEVAEKELQRVNQHAFQREESLKKRLQLMGEKLKEWQCPNPNKLSGSCEGMTLEALEAICIEWECHSNDPKDLAALIHAYKMGKNK